MLISRIPVLSYLKARNSHFMRIANEREEFMVSQTKKHNVHTITTFHTSLLCVFFHNPVSFPTGQVAFCFQMWIHCKWLVIVRGSFDSTQRFFFFFFGSNCPYLLNILAAFAAVLKVLWLLWEDDVFFSSPPPSRGSLNFSFRAFRENGLWQVWTWVLREITK